MAARRRKRWKKILPTITLTAVPFVWSPPAANAFFPPIVPPPVVVPPVVVPPVVVPPVVVPPVVPPPFVPPVVPPVIVPPVVPPPVVVPPPPCDCHGTPTCTPEPVTIVSTLFGLAAVAGYQVVRRKVGQKEVTREDGGNA